LLEKFISNAREKLLKDHLSLYQQDMGMVGLGNSLSRLGDIRKAIPFDNGDFIEVIGKDSRGQKTGNATTNGDRMRPLLNCGGVGCGIGGRA
jgi:hypothetical protein